MRILDVLNGGWVTGNPRAVWAHLVRRGRHTPFKMTRRGRNRRCARRFVRGVVA